MVLGLSFWFFVGSHRPPRDRVLGHQVISGDTALALGARVFGLHLSPQAPFGVEVVLLCIRPWGILTIARCNCFFFF